MAGPERFRAALAGSCAHAGLDSRDATVLHVRGNAVYHLPREAVVVRLRPAAGPADELLAQLAGAIEIARWLCAQGFPATEPLDAEQPVLVAGHVATFWRYVTVVSGPRRDARALGRLIRQLHSLPTPPVPLRPANPLGSLRADAMNNNAVTASQREWLLARADELDEQSGHALWTLGTGLVHGDAHVGNLLHAPARILLCDWDSVSYGPRELDLVPTSLWRRYGRQGSEWEEFCAGYQVDPDNVPGLLLLQQFRELHALAAYMRNAADDAFRAELARRIDSLQAGSAEPWNAL